VRLTEHKFDDPEQAIPTLEAAIAAEPALADWLVPENRVVIRSKLLLRLCEPGDIYL
jgi:hypothetical protein